MPVVHVARHAQRLRGARSRPRAPSRFDPDGHSAAGSLRSRVTKWLKEDPELKAIPVVAVTAFAMKGDEERIRENRSHHFRRTAGRPFRGRSGTDRPQEHGSEQSAIRCPRYGGSGRSPHHEQPPFGLRLYCFATIGITPTV